MDFPEPTSTRRLIKRYSNRKLYDTKGSRYVTLLEIGEMVRAGEEVQVIDNRSKEDKTEVTLALIISEELKERPRGIPIPTLKALIRHRGERLLSTLREGPIGRLIPKEEGELASSEVMADPGALGGELNGAAPDSELGAAAESADGTTLPASASETGDSETDPRATSNSDAPGVPTTSLRNLRRTLEQWQVAVDERIRSVLPASADVDELKFEVRALTERVARLEQDLAARDKTSE